MSITQAIARPISPPITQLITGEHYENIAVSNAGFETAGGGGADVLASWSEATAGTSTVTQDLVEFYTGLASCKLSIDSSNSNAQISQAIAGLSGGDNIILSFMAKASGGRWRCGTVSNYEDIDIASTWTKYNLNLSLTGGTLVFKRVAAGSQTLNLDNIEIKKIV